MKKKKKNIKKINIIINIKLYILIILKNKIFLFNYNKLI